MAGYSGTPLAKKLGMDPIALREMIAAGAGRGFLPAILGHGDARLRRLPDAAPPMSVPIWVGSQAELAVSARLRAVREVLIADLARQGDALAGRAAP